MKKLLLIILILLPCEIGAQEGCGEWVPCESAWLTRAEEGVDTVRIDRSVGHYTYYKFLWTDNLPPPDSVWVPKSCPPESISATIDTVSWGVKPYIEDHGDLFARIDSLEKGLLPAYFCTTFSKQETTTIRIDIELLIQEQTGDSTWRWNPETKKMERSGD